VDEVKTVEKWASLECVGASAYDVSDQGRVRSHKTRDAETGEPYILRLGRCDRGYMTACLQHDDGRQRSRKVHVLVARAFIGERPPGMLVCHGNDVPSDNRLKNLRYATRAENYRDSVANGARTMGPRPAAWGRGRLTTGQVRAIRRAHASGRGGYRTLAKEYGVSRWTVREIIRGESYGWVGDDAAEQMRIKCAAEARLRRAREERRAEREPLEIEALERVAPRPGQRRRAPHTPPAAGPRSRSK
jgi:hypothetical protein